MDQSDSEVLRLCYHSSRESSLIGEQTTHAAATKHASTGAVVTWISYVDESIDELTGTYVLAAATLEQDGSRDVRDAVRALAPRLGQWFHWKDQERDGRVKAVEFVSTLAILHTVVMGTPVAKQERARRQCLRSLLFHLEGDGVEQVWLESRGAPADSRDISAVRAFRAQHAIGHTNRVDHAFPSAQPLLWVADIVAGAVRAAERGDDTYRAHLGTAITEHRIRLD